uniref:Uncharacterized protein n=1 Tax=Anguilla anguilla TaxID=7936 RepID=A0A0E9QYJ8_ANGAN
MFVEEFRFCFWKWNWPLLSNYVFYYAHCMLFTFIHTFLVQKKTNLPLWLQ